MKNKFFRLLFLAAMLMGVLSPIFAGNQYLWTFENYSVQSMGNNVLRFTIPLWVYGKGDNSTEYLEAHWDNNNDNKDSYFWYSEVNGSKRGSADVHRIISFGADRGNNYDSRKSGYGYAYALVDAGSCIVQNMYDGTQVTLTEGDRTHWCQNWLVTKRQNTSYVDHVVFLIVDWHMPVELQEKTFYLGVNAHTYYASDGDEDTRYLWGQWPTKYTGGDIPQGPQLFQPYFYQDVSSGMDIQGKAGVTYVTYQDPISYHTSLHPNVEMPASQRSDNIIVQMTDQSQRMNADFEVWTDTAAQLKQRLISNTIDIPAYHKPYNLQGDGVKYQDEKTGKWFINYRYKKLTWEIYHPSENDIIVGDVFELQRAYRSDYSDAETIQIIPMEYDTLQTDTTTDVQTYTYIDSVRAAWWNPVENSYRIYYRLRRGSSSMWEWDDNRYAVKLSYYPAQEYSPYIYNKNLKYSLAPDFETSHQVNISLELPNKNMQAARSEETPGFSYYYYDSNQRFILRKIMRELEDTVEVTIPSANIQEALNRSYLNPDNDKYSHEPITILYSDVVSAPCVHYEYEVYIDTTSVTVYRPDKDYPAHRKVTPATDDDMNVYFTEAANIQTFTASKITYSDCVLLSWEPTDGNVGLYKIETRPAGKDTTWALLADSLTGSWFKDFSANPYVSPEWEYRLTMTYECNGNIMSSKAEAVGSRNPYGKVSGYIRYEDGTACPNITVDAIHTSTGEKVQTVETDENGYYMLDSLRYGSGYSYAITPTSQTAQFEYNHTSSGTATITLGLDDCIAENINFINISSVLLSGRVLYKNTTIPARDVNFLLNGVIVKQGTTPYKTNASGNFEFLVPKGSAFTIQAVKDGHWFAGDGYVRMLNRVTQREDSLLTLDGPLPGVRIYDETKVRLIGRLAGGKTQAEKTIGFGLSNNNLGDDLQMVFELEGDNISHIVSIPEDKTIDHIDMVVRHDVRDGELLDSVGSTFVEYQKKRIIIRPDSLTGEYEVDLFPVKYKITQATAKGYATLYAEGKTSETLDLTNGPLHRRTNTHNGKEVDYNECYSITYHSPIKITCTQLRYGMEVGYYGEETIKRQNVSNQKIEVPIAQKQADGTYSYLFGAPVFNADTYQFRVTAHEDYYYNNEPNSFKHEEVRLQGGMLKVYNGMYDDNNTQIQTKELDTLGQADIIVPINYVSFLKTGEDALRVLDLSVEYEGAYVQSQALKAYVVGDKTKGQEFTASTHGSVVLLDVLRDPPGGGSSAYIEKGSNYTYNYNIDLNLTFGLGLTLKYGTGTNIFMGAFAGVGGGVWTGTQTEVSTSSSATLPIVGSFVYKHSGSYTFTTAERITTGADPMSVGSSADVYIGAMQNVMYGMMDAVQPIDSLTYVTLAARAANGTMKTVAEGRDANGNKYYLAIGTELGAESYIKSTFAFTQDYIENTLLAQLIERRNALLMTGDSATIAGIVAMTGKPAYWSKVAPDNEYFGMEGYYVMICPDDNKPYDDEVASCNREYVDWVGLLIQNEREKVDALRGAHAELVGTWSVGGSTGVTHSETYNYSNSGAKKFFFPGLSFDSSLPSVTKNLAGGQGASMIKLMEAAFKQNGSAEDKPIKVEGKAPGATWNIEIQPILDLDWNRSPATEGSAHTKSTGFTLKTDDWAYGHMNVSVYRVVDKKNGYNDSSSGTRDFTNAGSDYLYGSYVYFLNGGATRCPWQGPDSTRFYTPKVALSAGTFKLENPKLDIDVHERSDVPVDQAAIFNLRLTNEGEVGYGTGNYAIPFTLKLEEGANPKGVRILIDGAPLLEEGRQIRLTRGEVVNKLMQVYAGEGYDFEDITLALVSPCMLNTKGQCTFSVHYMPVACPVNISAPHDKWIMNTLSPQDSAGWYLPVVIDGFDINYKGFDHIEFQYKLTTQSDEAWVNLCSYYANDSLYDLASGSKAMISGGRIENIRFYGERDPMEQKYDLRAVAFCRHGNSFITRASDVLSGVKDTRPPRLFGEPEPTNSILGVGANLLLRFNEPIAGNYLDEDNNFQVIGFTNESDITTGISLHFDETESSYAESKVLRSISNKSFSIDMLVKPTDPNAAATFFNYETRGKREFTFGKTADNRLKATLGENVLYSDTLSEPMTAFTRVAMVYDHDLRIIRFYAGTEDVTDPSVKPLPQGSHFQGSAPICIGRGFQGNMMEVRLWSKALSGDEIAETYLKRLTGYERELVAYYPMNEGSGDVLVDKANGANLYTHGASWEHQKGISLKLNAQQQVKMDGDLLSRSNKQDETLMFWFKTETNSGNIFCAGRMDDAHGTLIGFDNGVMTLKNYENEWMIPGNYADNNWHHFVLTVNRAYNSAAIYLDDQMKYTFAATKIGEVSGTMYLGGNGFQGNIDEFVIFEQALPKSLMQSFGTISPVGDEMGLVAYLPFSEMKENESGILEQVFSVNDQRIIKVNGETVKTAVPLILSVTGGGKVDDLGDMSQSAPVQDIGLLTKMNFDWSFNNDELMINLNMPDREINKQTIYVTVRDVEDLNGNPIVSPVTLTTFVDRNAIKWEKRDIEVKAIYGKSADKVSRTIRVINHSGRRHQFHIESIPDWLSVDAESGSIEPTDETTITLSFNLDNAVGVYTDVLYLTDEEGLSEPLRVRLEIDALPPYSDPDEGAYPYNMSICGLVKIGDQYDTDPSDIVYAFFQNECVGKENISFDETANTSKVFMTVFGTGEMSNKPIRFQLWQASTGKVYDLRTNQKVVFKHGFVYSCGEEQPLVLTTSGSQVQNITINKGWNWISFNLDLSNNGGLIENCMTAKDPWTANDKIKNPSTRDFDSYDTIAGAFVGTLNKLHYSQMYMLYSAAGNTMRIAGESMPEDSMQIRVRGDGQWSVMPCLFEQNTPIAEALAGYYDNATPGDLIKAHNRFATFSSNNHWEGNLTALRPGEGYLFRRMGRGSVTIPFYKSNANPVSAKANAPASANDSEQFTNANAAANMTMIAEVQGDNVQGTKVNVYIGDELVGMALPNANANALYFLTIQSDQSGTLRFETEDGETLVPSYTDPSSANRTSYRSPSYIPDSHLGSLEHPIVLTPIVNADAGTYKLIENDHVVIIRNGEKYDVTGKKL